MGSCRDSTDLAELRGRIIQIFFKHLTSSNEVAVSMSQEGLAAVIAHQKMPKHLLQVLSPQTSSLLSQVCCILISPRENADNQDKASARVG